MSPTDVAKTKAVGFAAGTRRFPGTTCPDRSYDMNSQQTQLSNQATLLAMREQAAEFTKIECSMSADVCI